MVERERTDVMVIGAGQAGLASGYHLAQRGIAHVILEAEARVGDQWRRRYDSLQLYSPARYDSLPGMPIPLPGHAYPTGRQFADYLESYAQRFALPVRTGARVRSAEAPAVEGGTWTVTTDDRVYEAGAVVVATGSFDHPYTPEFAGRLDPGILQLHSSEYRNPGQLRPGPTLVVGLSHSGADLAYEVAMAGREVILSGKAHGQLPVSVSSRRGRLGWRVLKQLGWHVFTLDTPVGRKMGQSIRHGGALLLRWRMGDLRRAGVDLTEARTVGVRDGRPELADGRVLDVANVLWCTGFRRDYGWITPAIEEREGWPVERRGVTPTPGLYFVGLVFQYAFTSMLVLGAGRDAGYVVEHAAGYLGRTVTRPMVASAPAA